MPRAIRAIFLTLLLPLPVAAFDGGPVSESRIESVGGQTILHLVGSDYERGKAQGMLLRDQIHRSVEWLIKDLGGEQCKLTEADLAKLKDHQLSFIAPRYREELRGIADGAGVELARLELANVVPMRLAGSESATYGTKAIGGKLLLAQQLLSNSEAAAAPVLIVTHPAQGQAYVTLRWPGCLGAIAGMNDRGIAISLLDAPLAAEGAGGIPAGIIAREALRQSKTLVEALSVFENSRRSGGAIAIVADGKIPEARVLEMSAEGIATFGANDSAEAKVPHAPLEQAVRRSNHFVDTRLAEKQRTQYDPRAANGLIGAESFARYEQALQLTQSKDKPITIAQCIANLRACAGPNPAIEQTLLSPSELDLWVSVKGEMGATGAEKRPFVRLNLAKLIAGEPAAEGLVVDTTEKPLDDASERLVKGNVQPPQRTDEASLPEIYRMDSASFAWEMEPEKVVQGIVRSKVRIPSPITSPHPENNTIPVEYFRPFGKGPFACVIVLHIAGGDFELSRFMCNAVSQGGIATVFVKLPYYGERQPPGTNIQMLSPDVGIASGAMQQTVLDLRRVCDWVDAHPELDGNRIGLLGVSLGSITGALATAIEPRINHACFIMGGSHLHDIIWESSEKEAREYRKLWESNGGTRESLAELLRPYDSATYADRLRQRVVLMICASEDESVPKSASMALWEASGKQKIIWYPCGHYTMVRYLMPALGHTVKFFREWPPREANEQTTAGN